MDGTLLLEKVPVAEKLALSRLLELYIYDFTEFLPLDVNEEGAYGYSHLDSYWNDPDRHPFFVKMDGKLAGFVLVRRFDSPEGDSLYSIAEFFIMKRYRRHGLGKNIAQQIFSMFPGRWEVFQLESNLPAQAFWRRAIGDFTDNRYEEKQEEGKIYQTFSVSGRYV